jgi:hypothetical protein
MVPFGKQQEILLDPAPNATIAPQPDLTTEERTLLDYMPSHDATGDCIFLLAIRLGVKTADSLLAILGHCLSAVHGQSGITDKFLTPRDSHVLPTSGLAHDPGKIW